MPTEAPKSNFCRKITETAEDSINIMRVAPQWCIPAITGGSVGMVSAYKTVEFIQEGKILPALFTAGATLLSGVAGYLSGELARGYLDDYKIMKRRFGFYGWDERIIARKVTYYCGKRAARFAAIDSGYKEAFDSYLEYVEERKSNLSM